MRENKQAEVMVRHTTNLRLCMQQTLVKVFLRTEWTFASHWITYRVSRQRWLVCHHLEKDTFLLLRLLVGWRVRSSVLNKCASATHKKGVSIWQTHTTRTERRQVWLIQRVTTMLALSPYTLSLQFAEDWLECSYPSKMDWWTKWQDINCLWDQGR
jgi:hypothetical protein